VIPRRRRRARALIENLSDTTELDADSGAVRSVQRADLLIDERAIAELWNPAHLERLARTYWRFLGRVTLGIIHVSYTETERSVVLFLRPLRLLTFHAPEYEMDPVRGLVRWRIARGMLVSRRGRNGRGHLQIEVTRGAAATPVGGDEPAGRASGEAAAGAGGPATTRGADGGVAAGDGATRPRLHVEVEVANFYPSIAAGLGRWFYNVTQSRIHVIVTSAFLRSLATLDLAESRVGRLGGGSR
jgi:hypothetical protein